MVAVDERRTVKSSRIELLRSEAASCLSMESGNVCGADTVVSSPGTEECVLSSAVERGRNESAIAGIGFPVKRVVRVVLHQNKYS